MREDVISLLNAFGVTGAEADPLIDFVLDSVVERVKNETNLNTIPEGLKKLTVEMALGQYLSLKKNLGQLEGFDLEAAVKQIQEGDTNTVFAIGEGNTTPEQRLDTLINYLINGRNREFIRYRRVVW